MAAPTPQQLTAAAAARCCSPCCLPIGVAPRKVRPHDLKPAGEATIVTMGTKGRVAAFNDDGKLRCVSATCTHLGCSVSWNAGERSWDCACHGSRFGLDGQILHGPATQPLKVLDLEDLA